MKFTLSYIPLRLFPAIMLVVFYALMQALAFHPLVPVPFGLLLLKSAVDAVILAGAAMLLMIIIPSSNYVKLNTAQRVINYAAIGLLFVILWMMAGFLSSYTVFGKDHLPLLRECIHRVALVCDRRAGHSFGCQKQGRRGRGSR